MGAFVPHVGDDEFNISLVISTGWGEYLSKRVVLREIPCIFKFVVKRVRF
jgi:hypothetical protein